MNKLHILTTYDQILQLRTYLASEKQHVKSICAFDSESTGRSPHKETVIGWSISIYDDEGFYIPFKTWTDDDGLCTEAPLPIPKEGQNVTQKLHDCISLSSLALAIDMIRDLLEWRTIMHNATYDVILVKCDLGINLLETIYSDTMLKKHTVNSDRPHGLKECGLLYIGEGANDEQLDLKDSVIRNGGKWNKQDKWIWRGDLKYVGRYAAKDTVITLQLESALDKPLDDLGLRSFYYQDLVIPLLKTSTIPMQLEGFPIDVDYFRNLKLDLQAEIKELQVQIYNEIRHDIKDLEQTVLDRDYPVRSGGRFGEALLEYMNIDIPMLPNGNFSTAKKVVDAWKPQVLRFADENQIKVIWFVSGECDKVPKEIFQAVQVQLFMEDNPGDLSPVNLNSGAQFAEVVYKKWKITSPKTSKKTGQASFDADVIESLAIDRIQKQFEINQADATEKFEEYMEAKHLSASTDWFVKYLRVRKLDKLLANYIELILELEIDGVIYTNLNQAGTTSGRYSSSNPNCFSLDTEVLTSNGWKTYDTWQADDKVASYNAISKQVEFELPLKIWKSETETRDMVTVNNQHLDVKVTSNHRLLILNRKTDEQKVVSAGELVNMSLDHKVLHGAICPSSDLQVGPNLLKFVVAFQADGNYSSARTIRFTFTKDRKASRLLEILDNLKWGYKHTFKGRHEIYVYGKNDLMYDILGKDKEFPYEYINLAPKLKVEFIEELMYWDGSFTRKQNYCSARERNADVVQAIACLCGFRAHKRKYVYKGGNPSYQIDLSYKDYSLTSNALVSYVKEHNQVWCLETTTGYVVARRGSDTLIIGQCQNLPAHSELGKMIKMGFIAERK